MRTLIEKIEVGKRANFNYQKMSGVIPIYDVKKNYK